MKAKHSIAVIIPMHNEEKVAELCIEAVIRVLKKLSIFSQLIVVNDGSRDQTPEILKKLQIKHKKNLIVLTHRKNRGYGGASQTGISYALEKGFEWALHMDSDLTNDPKYIPYFTKFATMNVDCVKASRYIKGAQIFKVPLYRRAISTIGNYIASSLFHIGIKDCTNGFRMTRLNLLRGVKFQENNFSIILEELYQLKKRGARFAEIPYTITARTDSLSHFMYKPKIFADYFKYVLKSIFV